MQNTVSQFTGLNPEYLGNSDSVIDAKVVLLTHYIPLYQVRVFQEMSRGIRDFSILSSTEIEPNRDFKLDWGNLQVDVQKNITLKRRWRHPRSGFDDPLFVHVPYDTLAQLGRRRPDVVLSLELGMRSLAAAVHRQLHRSSRLVICGYMSEYTEKGRGAMRLLLRHFLLRQADAITYNGPSCRSYLKKFDVPDEKLFHLPYAADDRNVLQNSIERSSENERKLICVGQLSERKGVLPFIQQLATHCRHRTNRKIELTLVGTGPLATTIESTKLPTNLTLKLTGNIPAHELPEVMANHGLLVLPTLADEWSLVVNEAFHSGLPVLGSRYAQASTTLIKNRKNGWIYDPFQPGDLSSKLDDFWQIDSADLSRMRLNAIESIADRNPSYAAEGALQAIHSVLSR